MEYDLAKLGIDVRQVGTPVLTWRRLRLFVHQLAEDRSTNLWRELAGEWADWTPAQQVRAAMVNALRVANWQRTEDATKKAPQHYPEPLLPPGVELDNENRQVERFGSTRMTFEETDAWLGWKR